MSNIVFTTIDAAYPVAGVDNDTQGFRDNFSIIQTGLETAATEIGSLQVRTAKLTTDNNGIAENDFNESSIIDASLDSVTFKLSQNDINAIVPIYVDVSNGHYQVYTIGEGALTSDLQFSIEGWPVRNTNRGVAKLTLEFIGNNINSNTINFISSSNGTILYNSTFPRVEGSAKVTISGTTPTIIDFWSYNQGTTIYAEYKGQFTS